MVLSIALGFGLLPLRAGGLQTQGIPLQQEQQAGTHATALPQPIPLSELAQGMEQTNLRLLDIQAQAVPDARVEAIQNMLSDKISELQKFEKSVQKQDIHKRSLRMLHEATIRWRREKSLFSDWQASLIDRSQQLEALLSELEWMHALWDTTYKTAVQANVPIEIHSRIRSIQRSIARTKIMVRKRLNVVLTLQNKISNEIIAIAKVLSRFAQIEAQARKQWLKSESQPLWKALSSPAEKVKIKTQFRVLWNMHHQDAKQFFRDYKDTLSFHAMLGSILFILLLLLLWRSKKWIVDESAFSTAAHILSRPFATTFLIWILFADALYPYAPTVIRHLASILLLFPLLRLLPGLLAPSMRAPFYLISAMYMLQQVYDLAVTPSLFQRIFLLITTLLLFVGLVWLARPGGRAAKVSAGPWRQLAYKSLNLAIVITFISILANIFGNVFLADLLARATLFSMYTAIVFFTLVLVLEGLLTALFQTRVINSLRMFRNYSTEWQHRLARLLHFAAFFSWLYYALTAFEIFDPLWGFVGAALGKRWFVGSIDISLGDILVFSISIYIAVQLSKLTRLVLSEDVLPKLDMPRGVPAMISIVVHYLILGFGILIALSAAGIEWSKFALVAGALGVGIGFGLQNLVNNFVSGLILIFERPIKIGDTIEVGQLRGLVKRIGIRSSTVRTYDGAEVIVPNANFISNQVVNWTLSDRLRRIEISIGVAYGTDPQQVLDLLEEIARKHPDVLDYPEPYAIFLEFADSALLFSLRFWTAEYESWLSLQSKIAVQINQALKDADIHIPFPQRDLHLRSVDESIALGQKSTGAKRAPKASKAVNSPKASKSASGADEADHV